MSFARFGQGARAVVTLGAFQNAPEQTRPRGLSPAQVFGDAADSPTRPDAPSPPDGSSGPWPYVIGGALMVAGVGFLAATLAINGRSAPRSASR